MASTTTKKFPRVKPKTYTTCLLYHTEEAKEKLKGITLAACNPKYERKVMSDIADTSQGEEPVDSVPTDLSQLTVSLTMSCNYCDVIFENRLQQKRHYRSDWHRYNLKLRLRGKSGITEEQFEIVSGNISSLSGSDTEDDTTSDLEAGSESSSAATSKRLVSVSSKLEASVYTSTDSESEAGAQAEEAARRLPKVYFRNEAGELLSLYRCVISHKKNQPSTTEDLITMTTKLPNEMNWVIFMAGGGHFAAAVFSKDKVITHKTFHRYVVRAKRGTAQSSRDSQGNAPKSGGASLRRYNEAALTEEIQELIHSWKDHMQTCDRIFLRAPSFNRKIFFGGKTPPLQKDDMRIRLIPFQTRRPTFNEVRRVYEMLASIECYGDEADIQEFIPISPPQVFNRETGQLETKDETQLSPRHRKLINKKLRGSPLVTDGSQASGDQVEKIEGKASTKGESKKYQGPVPGHILDEENQSSGTSTTSETELVEMMQTISTLDLKEFGGTKKPKRRKKSGKKRSGLKKCQTEPESNVMEEEKYHLKNSLYTACKVGDVESLKNLLAVFLPNMNQIIKQSVNDSETVAGDLEKNKSQSLGNQSEETAEVNKTPETDNFKVFKSCVEGCDESVTESIHSVKHEDNSNGSSNEKKENFEVINDTDFANKNIRVIDSVGDRSESETPQKPDKSNISNEELSSAGIDKKEPTTGSLDDDKVESYNSGLTEVIHNHNGNITPVDDGTVKEGEHVVEISQSNVTNDVEDILKSKTDINNTNSNHETHNISEDHSLKDPTLSEAITSSAVPSKLEVSDQQQQSSKNSLPLTSLTDLSPVVTSSILNEPFGDSESTLLHVAAREGHKAVVVLLMECGATPAIRDKAGQTPYTVSKDKSVRNEFRKFMGRWPEKYDYVLAQIPAPLSEEQEAERRKKENERKRAKQKEKKERLKVKKEEEDKKNAEEKERLRYLNLSDREKRALAAERRLVQQVSNQGGDKPVLSRCFQCAEDMTGKVPFEYSDFKFCSPKCLQLHRKSKITKS